MVIDEEAKDKTPRANHARVATQRDVKAVHRRRRKRSKYTKSANVPFFSLWIEEESGEPEEQNRMEK